MSDEDALCAVGDATIPLRPRPAELPFAAGIEREPGESYYTYEARAVEMALGFMDDASAASELLRHQLATIDELRRVMYGLRVENAELKAAARASVSSVSGVSS